MNFSAFLAWREQSLRADPGLFDCAEANLYRSLESLQPKSSPEYPDFPLHRCDLARAWLIRNGFPDTSSRHALVCLGVRHALTLIFKELRRNNAKLWIPRDVYPVYLELAQAAGIAPHCFSTLPKPEFPACQPDGSTEYILITNPWKPLGRYLTETEVAALESWLDASPCRWLLMDCVYDLNAPFHFTTRTLHKTGRAILLHSVTKGWLWPRTFGVALINECHSQFETIFRNEPPAQKQLRLAHQFLTTEADCPNRVSAALRNRANNLFEMIPDSVRTSFLVNPALLPQSCYFFPVKIGAEELLRHHRLLPIPASVFGSDWNGSVLTSLSPVFSSQDGGSR